MTTMAEMERKLESLGKRVQELEAQVDGLKMRPPVLHFHYPEPAQQWVEPAWVPRWPTITCQDDPVSRVHGGVNV